MGESKIDGTKMNNSQIKISEQVTKTQTYEIESPEVMNNIKQSVDYCLRNNTGLLKEILTEFIQKEPDFLRALISKSVSSQTEEITLRTIDKPTAKIEIQQFIQNNPGCVISDIIENLKIDPEMVFEIIKEFKNDNLLTDRSIESE